MASVVAPASGLFDERPNASIGVSPTEATRIRRRVAQGETMTAPTPASSRLAAWLSFEPRSDRYASYAAFLLGLLGLGAALLLV